MWVPRCPVVRLQRAESTDRLAADRSLRRQPLPSAMDAAPAYDTLVWAKLEGYRHWPGLVLDPAKSGAVDAAVKRDLVADGQETVDTVLIRFLGTGDHARLPLFKLLPLLDNSTFKQLSAGGKRGGGFDAAVTEALAWLQRHGKKGKAPPALPSDGGKGKLVKAPSTAAAVAARSHAAVHAPRDGAGDALADMDESPCEPGTTEHLGPVAPHRGTSSKRRADGDDGPRPNTASGSASGGGDTSGQPAVGGPASRICGANPPPGVALSAATLALQSAAAEAAADLGAAQRAAAAAHRRAEAARHEVARCDAAVAEAAHNAAAAAERARAARQAADTSEQHDWSVYEQHLRQVAAKARAKATAAAVAAEEEEPAQEADWAAEQAPPDVRDVQHAQETGDMQPAVDGDAAMAAVEDSNRCLPLKKRRR